VNDGMLDGLSRPHRAFILFLVGCALAVVVGVLLVALLLVFLLLRTLVGFV